MDDKLQEKIGVLAGSLSACWENLEGAGEFQSELAVGYVNEILTLIESALSDHYEDGYECGRANPDDNEYESGYNCGYDEGFDAGVEWSPVGE